MRNILITSLLVLIFISCEKEIEAPSLSPTTVSNVTNYTADITCTVTSDGGSQVDSVGICWSTDELPSIDNSTFVSSGSNTIDFQIKNLIPKTKYFIRAFAINEKGLFYSSASDFTTEPNETSVFIDSRDGQAYKIVKIGETWWFAENLNFKSDNSWYFNDDSVNYSSLGRLYTNESATNALPSGWKLPTDNDWVRLENQIGITAEERANDHWRGLYEAQYLWEGREFDFDVKWSGIRDNSLASLYYNDGSAYFWTSIHNKEISDSESWFYCRQVYKTLESLRRLSKPSSNGLSVRCIKE